MRNVSFLDTLAQAFTSINKPLLKEDETLCAVSLADLSTGSNADVASGISAAEAAFKTF